MKITYIFFVSVYGLFILFVGIGSAANYTFTWDASHPNDNVVEFKIYYRMNSSTYNVTDFKAGRLLGLFSIYHRHPVNASHAALRLHTHDSGSM